VRVLIAALGVAAMIAAALQLSDLSALGFPDGYIAPYDRATLPWVTGLAYVLLLAGIFAVVAAVMKRPRRAIAGLIIAVLLYASLRLIETCPRLDWCTTGLMQLTGTFIDDGTGG
jgi:hypothetical protein